MSTNINGEVTEIKKVCLSFVDKEDLDEDDINSNSDKEEYVEDEIKAALCALSPTATENIFEDEVNIELQKEGEMVKKHFNNNDNNNSSTTEESSHGNTEYEKSSPITSEEQYTTTASSNSSPMISGINNSSSSILMMYFDSKTGQVLERIVQRQDIHNIIKNAPLFFSGETKTLNDATTKPRHVAPMPQLPNIYTESEPAHQSTILPPVKLYKGAVLPDHYKSESTQVEDKDEYIMQCHLCFKRFENIENLSEHLKDHANEICDLVGPIQKNRKRNVRYSDGSYKLPEPNQTYPFKCTSCVASFSRSSNLQRHTLSHLGIKPHKCTVCGYAFVTKNHLKVHIRTHTGEKPFKCHLCEKRFTQQINLKRHIMVHTGEKPYKCHCCKAAFMTSTDLKRHIRIHTGEKPHKCDLCDKAFATSSNFKSHYRLHIKES